ncbi:putative protein kinase [Trypanosoma grayi]|uniref:putative protein kinase n=1 Tax=Trypanosoma grayi TaxID=71804 RepID=UPI0004F49239|nr:putative protein kinase [Trypanosoma grayi]KEG12627.1 putative protein kinase [Trypanosoma grayi]
MEGGDRREGPLSAWPHDNISELPSSLMEPSVVTVGVVPLISITDALRRGEQLHQNNMGSQGNISMLSTASRASSLNNTVRSCGYNSLHNMLGPVLDVPECIIIPLNRLRLFHSHVLGKGAFGEVVRGELYATSAAVDHLPTKTAFPRFPFRGHQKTGLTQGCSARSKGSCSEGRHSIVRSPEVDGRTQRTNSGSEPQFWSTCEAKKPPEGQGGSRLMEGGARVPLQIPQALPPPPRQLVVTPPMERLSCQTTLDDDVLSETTPPSLQPPFCTTSTVSDTMPAYHQLSTSTSFATDGPPRAVAVKRIDKARLSRRQKFISSFQTELHFAATLCHPSFITVHGVAEEDTELLLVMDLAEGGTLEDYIKTRGLEDTLTMAPRFLADVVLGLEYLRAVDVAHRDIKPCNMLLTSDYHVKLADMGTACHLDDDASNTFGGTAAYMSPEVVEMGKASATSDLWAMGCVLFQIFVGRPPFQGGNCMFVMRKIKEYRDGDLNYPPYFPAEARDLVQQLLRREPNDRLGSSATGGFDALKAHPFFASIDWSCVLQTSNIELYHADYLTQLQGLLEAGEKVVHCSLVLKESKRFLRKVSRQCLLVITDLPRLFYVEVATRVVKGNIPLTHEVYAEAETIDKFRVVTKERTYEFSDLNKRAGFWGMYINDYVKRCPVTGDGDTTAPQKRRMSNSEDSTEESLLLKDLLVAIALHSPVCKGIGNTAGVLFDHSGEAKGGCMDGRTFGRRPKM